MILMQGLCQGSLLGLLRFVLGVIKDGFSKVEGMEFCGIERIAWSTALE